MFGYVKVDRPECRIREYEYYRGVYCGLCRVLGRYGRPAKATLSYDFVFLALLRMAAVGESPVFVPRRCGLHPFRKRPMAQAQTLDYCARTSLILSYYKVKDDLADERGLRRLSAWLVLPFARRWRGRAARGLEELDAGIARLLEALTKKEKENGLSADAPAALFGEILGEIAAFGLAEEKARICRTIGQNVGHWIYLVDAIDDYAQDVKHGRYNPLASLLGGSPADEQTRESLRVSLLARLSECEKAFDLLEFPDAESQALLKNILYIGLPHEAERILNHEKNEKGDRLDGKPL